MTSSQSMPKGITQADFDQFLTSVVEHKNKASFTFEAYLDAFDWRGDYGIDWATIAAGCTPTDPAPSGHAFLTDLRPWQALYAYVADRGWEVYQIDLDQRLVTIGRKTGRVAA